MERWTLVGTAAVCALAAASGAAAQQLGQKPWVDRANAVCVSWASKSAALRSGPAKPVTAKTEYEYMQKVRTIEFGLLRALKALPGRRPVGTATALAAAARNLSELDAGIAAFATGNASRFAQDWNIWAKDDIANREFAALGTPDCA